MIVERAHYGNLPRRPRGLRSTVPVAVSELIPGPGVGLHYTVPVVELRSLAMYEEVAHVASV
jgi:hypothetical protein